MTNTPHDANNPACKCESCEMWTSIKKCTDNESDIGSVEKEKIKDLVFDSLTPLQRGLLALLH